MIEVDDVLIPCVLAADVVRSGLFPNVLREVDEMDTWVAKRRHDLLGVIRTCIANDLQLSVLEGLPPHALDREGEHITSVVDRGDDGHERSSWHDDVRTGLEKIERAIPFGNG